MRTIKILILCAFISVILQSCAEEPSPITSFTASQGNCIGAVKLAVEEVAVKENYSYERKNPQNNQWEQIYWGYENVFDDTGWGLPNDRLLPGQVYQYRVRAHTEKGGYGDYSEVVTGYMFSPNPHIRKIEYKEIEGRPGYYELEYRIVDKLPIDLHNLRERNLKVYRAESYDMTLNNSQILQIRPGTNIADSIIAGTQSSDSYDKNKTYYYKIEAQYEYWYNYEIEYSVGIYSCNSGIFEGGSYSGGDPGEEPGTINYTATNYGEINSSSSGAKNKVIHCIDGSTVYIGYLDDYHAAPTTGKPALMKNTGSSWTNAGGTMPAEMLADYGIGHYDFDVSSGTIYLAALSSSAIYVYKNDGGWSENLATPLLWVEQWGSSKTYYVDIAVFNNALYLTTIHWDDLKVFKYDGTTWEQFGSTIATGFYTNPKLKNIDGTLYLWYEEKVSGTSECTFHIKHLSGTSWVSDLEWSKDNAMGFDVVRLNGSLYFIQEWGKGSVCKVESLNSVTDIFENVGTFYGIPQSITVDASGNIIISCMKTDPDLSNWCLAVLVYDGTSWKKVNDDFSETSINGQTSAVQASGNVIHFIYGLKSSENDWNIPEILKARKYSK
jgi:hypothetical protein